MECLCVGTYTVYYRSTGKAKYGAVIGRRWRCGHWPPVEVL